ncbi:2-oxoglutarate dehydrogenase [Ralstonia sp. UBA689]|uniref:2-oxoglutarate dehydrogenase n=1 Tax=Ralstonia sp. UBA689 TaxID=1947373 RepID=UPI0025DC20B1|nr:2-oxoglutarate dehydrogenase [Ralstonia sp. UBA689]
MSPIDMLRRSLPPILLGVLIGQAYAAPTTQSVAPVTLPKGGHGVDGPFFPTQRAVPVSPTTGAQLQQEAQQRIAKRLNENAVLSNGGSITKTQAKASGLGFVAKHFDQIDTTHSGHVSTGDVQRYLQQSH